MTCANDLRSPLLWLVPGTVVTLLMALLGFGYLYSILEPADHLHDFPIAHVYGAIAIPSGFPKRLVHPERPASSRRRRETGAHRLHQDACQTEPDLGSDYACRRAVASQGSKV